VNGDVGVASAPEHIAKALPGRVTRFDYGKPRKLPILRLRRQCLHQISLPRSPLSLPPSFFLRPRWKRKASQSLSHPESLIFAKATLRCIDLDANRLARIEGIRFRASYHRLSSLATMCNVVSRVKVLSWKEESHSGPSDDVSPPSLSLLHSICEQGGISWSSHLWCEILRDNYSECYLFLDERERFALRTD